MTPSQDEPTISEQNDQDDHVEENAISVDSTQRASAPDGEWGQIIPDEVEAGDRGNFAFTLTMRAAEVEREQLVRE
jgi:hypothetical protein